jgi:hypothetical protein
MSAVASLIVAVVGRAAGIVETVAAVKAATCAKGSATQEGPKRSSRSQPAQLSRSPPFGFSAVQQLAISGASWLSVELANRCVGVEMGEDSIGSVSAGCQGGGSKLAKADTMADASALLGRAVL